MSLSVIIPSKTLSNLIPCVRAVRLNEPTARIIWVDDRETGCWEDDGYRSVESAAGGRNGLVVAAGIKPFVFAQNVNRGILCAGDNGVVILNDDALLQTPGGFTLLAQAAAEHPEFGIIGATTNVTGQPLQQPHGIGLREVEHFAFVCVYIPRTTIENPKVGLLDERYRLDYGCEDRDYCLAVQAAGLKVGVHDGCFVDHASLRSSFRGEPHAPLSYAKNYELLKAKWGNRLNA